MALGYATADWARFWDGNAREGEVAYGRYSATFTVDHAGQIILVWKNGPGPEIDIDRFENAAKDAADEAVYDTDD